MNMLRTRLVAFLLPLLVGFTHADGGEQQQQQQQRQPCWDNLTAIYEDYLVDQPAGAVHTIYVCPGTYNVGVQYGRGECCQDGQYPLITRTNTHYICGSNDDKEDDAEESECVLEGGDTHVMINDVIFEESVVNATVEGFTFRAPGRSTSFAASPGNVRFVNCIFEEQSNEGPILALYESVHRRHLASTVREKYASPVAYAMSREYTDLLLSGGTTASEKSVVDENNNRLRKRRMGMMGEGMMGEGHEGGMMGEGHEGEGEMMGEGYEDMMGDGYDDLMLEGYEDMMGEGQEDEMMMGEDEMPTESEMEEMREKCHGGETVDLLDNIEAEGTKMVLRFEQCTFQKNTFAPPVDEVPTYGIVSARSPDNILVFEDCVFRDNIYAQDVGYAISAFEGSSVVIENTCFVDNDFNGYGIVQVFDDGQYEVHNNFGSAHDGVTPCNFVAYSQVQPGSEQDVTCTNFDSKMCTSALVTQLEQ